MKKRENVLFVTIDGGGNLPPVLGLAQDLSESGFGISVLSEPCMEDLIRDLDLTSSPFRDTLTGRIGMKTSSKIGMYPPSRIPSWKILYWGRLK